MRPAAIETVDLCRQFGDVTALDRVTLSIAQGEFFSLLGPSGCGKTTLLRLIAGLDVPSSGLLRIGGQDALGMPAHRRPVNTVFQSYALFPHLDVWNNIAFGLRMKKVREIAPRVQKVMDLVQIATLSRRKPSQLSGGQKQRVALARAVVNEPEVLLLDEPLSALDLKLRKQLQVELRNLQRQLGMTFVYVTHDQEEALVLSDRIAVMHEGRIDQLGKAQEVYERPRTRFASQFLGSCSLLEAESSTESSTTGQVRTLLGPMRVLASLPARQKMTLAIRPEKVQLLPSSRGAEENCVRMQIADLLYVGSETHYELRREGAALRAEVMNTQTASSALVRGDEVLVRLPPEALIVLDD